MSFLEKKWQENRPQLIALWGKRRVGKTELVKQFIKDKPHIYFLGESTHEAEQLKRFSLAVGEVFNEPLLKIKGFDNWLELFRYLKDKNQRLVVVVDEFPYLIISNRAIPSVFQHGWDEYLSTSQVYLVLLGSSISMMESEVLGYRAPLYGRRTGQWQIDPMGFFAVSDFMPNRSFGERLSHYAVAGGIPAYWLQFSAQRDIWGNLTESVLSKGEPLYHEVEFILREELREPRFYFALLQAIAQGKRKLSEIVNATGIAQSFANKYLGVLMDLKIVSKELPITEEKPLKSKKGLYRIADEFFQFWFKYVFPHRSDLEIGNIQKVLDMIRSDWQQYVSYVYEKVAAEILWQYRENIFPFSKVGRWWQQNQMIDLVAVNKELDAILFAEVKWSQRRVGTDILEALRAKARQVAWGSDHRKEYY
ncbi:MAG: ATP-binding protein [candidate division KSB1 bacterium]|nr:ATP-binding protein [candidate division KSB1 bacterium]